jgi:hypothetical protein
MVADGTAAILRRLLDFVRDVAAFDLPGRIGWLVAGGG